MSRISDLIDRWERAEAASKGQGQRNDFRGSPPENPNAFFGTASMRNVPMAEVVDPPSPPRFHQITSLNNKAKSQATPVRFVLASDPEPTVSQFLNDQTEMNASTYLPRPPSAPRLAAMQTPQKTQTPQKRKKSTGARSRPPSSQQHREYDISPVPRAVDGIDTPTLDENRNENNVPAKPPRSSSRKRPQENLSPKDEDSPRKEKQNVTNGLADQQEVNPTFLGNETFEQRNVGEDEDKPKRNPFGQVVVPRSKRKCRDLLCLFLMGATWITMITISIVAARTGNVMALVNGSDYMGRVCGTCGGSEEDDEATCDNSFLVVDPNHVPGVFAVCRESCPLAGEWICVNKTMGDENGVKQRNEQHCWKSYVNQTSLLNRCVPMPESTTKCLESPYLAFVNESLPASSDDPMCGTCLDPVFGSDGIRPMDPSSPDCRVKAKRFSSEMVAERLHPVFEFSVSWSELILRWLADVKNSWQSIAIGGCAAFVTSILWMMIFACFANHLLWFTIILVLGGMSFVAINLLIAGGVIPQPVSKDTTDANALLENGQNNAALQLFKASDSAHKEMLAIGGWILIFFTIFLLVLTCSIRLSIVRTGAIMRGAARAILTNSYLWVIPTLSFGIIMGLFAWGATVVALLGSVGRMNSSTFANSLSGGNSTEEDQSFVDVNPALIIFMILATFWSIFFVRACGAMTISAVVASAKYREHPRVSVCEALKIVWKFHLGTAAFGSLIVALLQLLRWILTMIDRRAKRMALGKQNGCSKAMLAVMNCILTCFAAFFKFATRFSYVVVAIRGESFCMATKSACTLLASGIVDSGTSLFLAESALFFGRILVVACSCVCTWAVLHFGAILWYDVSSLFAPVTTAAILAWLISGACFDFFGAAIDTLIICKLDVRLLRAKKEQEAQEIRELGMV